MLPLVWAGRGSHAHAPTDALGAALDRLLAELASLDAPVAYLTLHDRSDRRSERRLGRLNLQGADVHAAIVAWLTPLVRAAATGGARCLRLRAFGPKGVHLLWSGTLRGAAAGLADGAAAPVDDVARGDVDEVEVLRRAAELLEGSGRAVDGVVARVLRARAARGHTGGAKGLDAAGPAARAGAPCGARHIPIETACDLCARTATPRALPMRPRIG